MTLLTEHPEHVVEVMPDLWRIQTPLPGHSFGTLNSYLLTSPEGAILIDAPWARPEVIESFRERIESTGTHPREIKVVLVTHYHEDHSGAAGWLQQEFGSKVIMHSADADALAKRFNGGTEFGLALAEWLDLTGVDEEGRLFAAEQHALLSSYAWSFVPDELADDGFEIEVGDWRIQAIHTPGHTAGSLCFLELRLGLLFVGDHIFERRRNNATARPFAADHPIPDYWASMNKLLATGADRVFPGHDEPFGQLENRASHLAGIRKHKRDEVVRLASVRSTAWQIAQRATRQAAWSSLDGNARLAAAGEALAYLLDAEDQGDVVSEGTVPAYWLATQQKTQAIETKDGRASVEPIL